MNMMIPICGLLGEAAAKTGAAPNTDDIADPQCQFAYMRGYERAKRRLAARKAKDGGSDG